MYGVIYSMCLQFFIQLYIHVLSSFCLYDLVRYFVMYVCMSVCRYFVRSFYLSRSRSRSLALSLSLSLYIYIYISLSRYRSLSIYLCVLVPFLAMYVVMSVFSQLVRFVRQPVVSFVISLCVFVRYVCPSFVIQFLCILMCVVFFMYWFSSLFVYVFRSSALSSHLYFVISLCSSRFILSLCRSLFVHQFMYSCIRSFFRSIDIYVLVYFVVAFFLSLVISCVMSFSLFVCVVVFCLVISLFMASRQFASSLCLSLVRYVVLSSFEIFRFFVIQLGLVSVSSFVRYFCSSVVRYVVISLVRYFGRPLFLYVVRDFFMCVVIGFVSSLFSYAVRVLYVCIQVVSYVLFRELVRQVFRLFLQLFRYSFMYVARYVFISLSMQFSLYLHGCLALLDSLFIYACSCVQFYLCGMQFVTSTFSRFVVRYFVLSRLVRYFLN